MCTDQQSGESWQPRCTRPRVAVKFKDKILSFLFLSFIFSFLSFLLRDIHIGSKNKPALLIKNRSKNRDSQKVQYRNASSEKRVTKRSRKHTGEGNDKRSLDALGRSS